MKFTYLLIGVLCGITCMLVADFIAQPKKKIPSTAKLKEQCAQELGAQLEHFARIMELCGKVQRTVLEHTYALLENDTDNPLHKKNNSALQQCHAKMCAFNETLTALEQQLREYHAYLETL